jgi:hypothetical protein
VGIIVLSIYLLLQLRPVQQKIKEFALQEIMKKTKSRISIGNLRFHPFNRLQLEDIYAADLKNDTLLYIEKLNAGFDFFKLFRKQFVIHSVEIDRFDLHLSKDSVDAPFNFRFLIDAFASDTTQQADSSKFQLAINHILLKNGRLRYDVFSEPFLAPELFDANHIDIQNLKLDAKLDWNDLNDWSSSVNHWSLDEKSGFALKQIKCKVKNQNNKLQIDHFYISLSNSEAEIQDANLDYTGLELNEILSGAAYSVHFNTGKCYLPDLSCFFPELAAYSDLLTCNGEIKGTLPEISLSHLELNYGKQLQFTLNGNIKDYNAWETYPFELNIETASANPGLFGLSLPADLIFFKGNVTGSLPDLKLSLAAESKQGNLTVNGTGGYTASSGNIHFDINMDTPEFNIKSLLSDSVFGNASFQLTAQGTITALNKIDVKADAEIRQMDYQGYSYNDITAHAAYVNDSISIDLISKNPRLSGKIHADIYGFDPELMTASIAIDSLHWVTSNGVFNASSITLSYYAGAGRQKQINLRSPILNVRGKGNITYEGLNRSIRQAFPTLFASGNYKVMKTTPEHDNFDFVVAVRQANSLAHLLGMETTIPDSAFFAGKYSRDGEDLNLNLNAFCIFSQSDTAIVRLNLSNLQNNLIVQLNTENRSNLYALEGNMGAEVEFIPVPKGKRPAINIALKPGSLTLNGASFRMHPAKIAIADNGYEISNFALQHSTSEYLKVNGRISDNTGDSILITVNRLEIGTILSAIKNKIPLSGTASGDITLSRMTTKPLVFTRNFAIEDMVFDGNQLGNLQLRSVWSSERQGLGLRATWNPPNSQESMLSGYVLPQKDSLALTANIRGVQLKWLAGYFPDNFYGFDGEIGAQLKIGGKTANPLVSGTVYLNNATVGISPLNTKYRMTDSVLLQNDQIIFPNCIVYDENNRNAKISGSIRHTRFSNLNPKLTIDFNDFLVLNNSEQTDSLFYGIVRANGNLNISLQNRDWLIQGRLSNGKANKIMINFPNQALEAERHNWLTFVDKPKEDSTVVVNRQPESEISVSSIPIRIQITLSVNPDLSLGAIINPDTQDAATITGRGVLDFSTSWPNPTFRLLGNYVINDGKCTLSLKNITKKTFSVQQGGKLNFVGDPMNTTFDLSAIYSLRASLTDLDPSFSTLLTTTKIPVNCMLTASGRLNNMKLEYTIKLPNQSDEIQRKLDGLIYSDEIKIKEMAYLLAFGSFMPVNSNLISTGNTSIWASLASSSITSQLNNLLSGVLKDNWTIGTDLHSSDAGFSDVDMDVNISTRLFNDRLTFNSTLGYHNNINQANNFTGDFNLEYKLTPGGNLLLQFYNVTNNLYYDRSKAPLTQGVGIVYKREGKTFRQLFRSFRTRTKASSQ